MELSDRGDVFGHRFKKKSLIMILNFDGKNAGFYKMHFCFE